MYEYKTNTRILCGCIHFYSFVLFVSEFIQQQQKTNNSPKISSLYLSLKSKICQHNLTNEYKSALQILLINCRLCESGLILWEREGEPADWHINFITFTPWNSYNYIYFKIKWYKMKRANHIQCGEHTVTSWGQNSLFYEGTY